MLMLRAVATAEESANPPPRGPRTLMGQAIRVREALLRLAELRRVLFLSHDLEHYCFSGLVSFAFKLSRFRYD